MDLAITPYHYVCLFFQDLVHVCCGLWVTLTFIGVACEPTFDRRATSWDSHGQRFRSDGLAFVFSCEIGWFGQCSRCFIDTCGWERSGGLDNQEDFERY